jgi:hypothetical protein
VNVNVNENADVVRERRTRDNNDGREKYKHCTKRTGCSGNTLHAIPHTPDSRR